MSPRLAVFDLDGVLLNSERLMSEAFRHACERCRVEAPPDMREFLKWLGRPLPEIVTHLGLPPEFTDEYQRFSVERMGLVVLYEGARDLVACARRRFSHLAVMTGKDRLRTTLLLERFGMRAAFDALVCGDAPFPGKPDPIGLHLLMSRFGASASSSLLVGDAPTDMLCGVRAGVRALGAGWGFSTSVELLAAGAETVFAHPADLMTWIESTSDVRAAARTFKQERITQNA